MECRLTDMWQAAGSPENKEPKRWGQTDQAKEFMASLTENLNVGDRPKRPFPNLTLRR